MARKIPSFGARALTAYAAPQRRGSIGRRLSTGSALAPQQTVALTVTYAIDGDSTTDRLANPCTGAWVSNPDSGVKDFTAITSDGTFDLLLSMDPSGLDPRWIPSFGAASTMFFMDGGTTPFLYTVSGPAGVVAQGSWTAHVNDTTKMRVIDEDSNIDDFINICLDGNHHVYSYNGGHLACDDTTGTITTRITPAGRLLHRAA